MSQPSAHDDEGMFHPEERQHKPDVSVTNSQLNFEPYGQILNRESRRDKSWLIGVIGLLAFLIIGGVALFVLFR